ncbi:hypothetical protein SPRG_06912 [Saprolegnia parasitica CBS 223.65]|uniref:Sugar phosphate transporter domain-containing protein n=1 Tax=Saprolegnia parasitica (strain CBS 223.65) TaxID=695850 RepID=A0A067CM87_SAPPC|nr:hypothetical protein SPRG_06912 [Saprolegnia parasitica CBS 223.65]KDO27641.1 hypothetical protein SPRG_06912 [Saprolegnia parasitica CBS 223.65]|eukprot:XP_012201763.1 hypothetical protein SPRG_06912 [Saprolegnia parasitica CBS 223.65]
MHRVRRLVAALWPCALYLVCSMSMNVLTKTILTSYGWRAVLSLAALQHVFTVSVLLLLHATRVLPLAVATLTWRVWLYEVAPLATLQSVNTTTAFVCMRLVNMPMYLVLRRLTTLKVLFMEIVVLKKVIPDAMKAALLVTALGSLLAGYHDASSDLPGYVLVVAQNCMTAASLVLSKQSTLSPLLVVWTNSVVGACLLTPLALAYEASTVHAFASTLAHPLSFASLFLLMSSVCLLYQVAIQLCTTKTSALATSVTGNIKDLASTGLGFLFFHDAVTDAWHVLGVGISFLGAYAFSFLKYQLLFDQKSPYATPLHVWWKQRHRGKARHPKAY